MVETSPQTIAERVKLLRHSKNLTQAEFGKMVNLVPSSVSKIEKGLSNPSERTISLICQKFHVRRPWLVEGEEPMLMETTEDDALIDILISREDETNTATKQLLRTIAENPNEDLAILIRDFYKSIRSNEALLFAASVIAQGSRNGNAFMFYFGEDKESIDRSTVINEQQIQTSCDMLSFAFSEILKKYAKAHREMVKLTIQSMMQEAQNSSEAPEE